MQIRKNTLLIPLGLIAALLGLWFALPAAAQSPARLNPYSLAIDVGTKTATAVAGAATLNKASGIITSEALATAPGATYTLTLTNSTIGVNDQIYASVWMGTATTGTPSITTSRPSAGQAVIVVQNVHTTNSLNGTIKIAFMTLEP